MHGEKHGQVNGFTQERGGGALYFGVENSVPSKL